MPSRLGCRHTRPSNNAQVCFGVGGKLARVKHGPREEHQLLCTCTCTPPLAWMMMMKWVVTGERLEAHGSDGFPCL